MAGVDACVVGDTMHCRITQIDPHGGKKLDLVSVLAIFMHSPTGYYFPDLKIPYTT